MDNPYLNTTNSLPALLSSPSFQNIISGAFVLGLLIYWSAAFFILYHLIRFGVGNQPKKIALIFLAGSLVFSIITSLFLYQIIL